MGNVWGERKEHRKDAEWLENFKRDFEYKEEQAEVEITPENIKNILRKMPNWKAPGPDCVQGFWLKNFKSIQEGLRRNLQKCLENGNVRVWMTKGRTILMQKDKENGKTASNYRPIACLGLEITNRCNCGRNLWNFEYRFFIISRTKKLLEKI